MLFDFGGTLVECPAWMDLELHDLVPVALAGLSRRGWVLPPRVDHDLGRDLLRQLRAVARETWRECPARRCLEVILPRLGVQCPPGPLLDEVLHEIYGGLLPGVRWLAGSRELLHSLNQEGIALALVSNAAYPAFVSEALAGAGVRHLFASVVVSADTGWRKPHPVPFLRALADLRVAPGDAVHVGDHFGQDVVGAMRAGIRPLWITTDAGPARGGLHAGAPPGGEGGGAPAGWVPARVTPVVVPDLEGAAAYLLAQVGSRGGEPPPPGR